MPLTEGQRRRFARHLLLAEIGDAQQAALCEARLTFSAETDAGVRQRASEYLRRAGVQVDDAAAGSPVQGATHSQVAAVAGSEALVPAAQALLGALEAVEQIKRITGVGTPGDLPPNLTLSREEP